MLQCVSSDSTVLFIKKQRTLWLFSVLNTQISLFTKILSHSFLAVVVHALLYS